MSRTREQELSPASYCQQALSAIEVSEGRRKKRKRDTGPDLTGMEIKRDLLCRAIADDPEPEAFEGWLMEQVARERVAGPFRAMAIEIYADYQNARMFQSFSGWLADGAPTPKVDEFGNIRGRTRKTTR